MVSHSEESVVAGIFDGFYPKNAIGERTVDEQLKYLTEIMKVPLVLKIVYNRTGLVVVCSIGLYNASVSGLDESMCVRQCKREILHKLFVSGTFTRNYDVTSTSFAADLHGRCHQTRSSGDLKYDDYSGSELCKERDAENTAKNVLDGIILVDSDMPRELPDFMDESKTPLVLEISYILGKWQYMTYKIEPHTVCADNFIKSPSMHQRKTELWQELIRAFAKVSWLDMVEEYEMNNTVTAQNELIDINQQCDPSTSKPVIAEPVIVQLPTAMSQTEVSAKLPEIKTRNQPIRSFNILESAEKYVIGASESLTNATRDTFQHSAKSFYDNLVRAFHANRFHVNKITNYIVSNAIDNPDNCAIIVDICCNAIEKASVHSDATVRHGMAGAFKHGLVQFCRGVLRQAGILLQAKTTGQPSWNAGRFEQLRDRTHGACRFMGQMFMKNQMFNIVKEAVHMFMQTNDVNLLECLCVLLNYITPKLKKIIDDPRRVFDQLKRYSRAGWMGNIYLPQRTLEMIKPLLNVKESNNPTSLTPSASFHSQRGNFGTKRNNTKSNYCQYQLKSGDYRVRRTHNPGIVQNGQNPPSSTSIMPTQPLNPLLESDDTRTPLTHNPEILRNGHNPLFSTPIMPTQPLNPLLESDDIRTPQTNNSEILRNGHNLLSSTSIMPTQPLNPLLESDDTRTPLTHNPEILRNGHNPLFSTPIMPTQPLNPLLESDDIRTPQTNNSEILRNGHNLLSSTSIMPIQPLNPLLESDDIRTPWTNNPDILRNGHNPPSSMPIMPTQSQHPLLESDDYRVPYNHNVGVLLNDQNPPSSIPTMPKQPLNPPLVSENHHARRIHNPGVLRNSQNPSSNTPKMCTQPVHPLMHSENHRAPHTHKPNILQNAQNLPSYTHTMPTQPINPLLQSDNHHARHTNNPGVLRIGQNPPLYAPIMPIQPLHSLLHPILQSGNHHARHVYYPGVLRNGQNLPSNTPTMPSQPLHPLLHLNNHRAPFTHNPNILRNGQNPPSFIYAMPTQPTNLILQSDNHHARLTHNPGVLRNGQNLPSNTPTMGSQPLHPLLQSDDHRARCTLGHRVMWYGQNIPHNTRMMPTQHNQGRVNFIPVVYVPSFPRHQ